MRKYSWYVATAIGSIILGYSILVLQPLFIHFKQTTSFEDIRTVIEIPHVLPVSSPQMIFWSLLLTGDIITARVTNQKMVEKSDFIWPLTNIIQILQNADVTLINLESSLLTNCPVTNEGFKFCGDARFSKSLQDAGVDVVNLANNHSLNYGWEGILETEEQLQKVGIETTGFTNNLVDYVISNEVRDPLYVSDKEGDFSPDGHRGRNDKKACEKNIYCSKLTIKVIQNLKIGFLGYNAVGQKINRVIAEAEIREAKKQVDVLVVSVHWGKEYTHEPMPDMLLAPDDPKELGTLFIDWGADVVAGNHPHWVQYLEWYKDRPIIFAQGNTIFDQEWSEETKKGVLVKFYFSGTEILKNKIEVTPIGIRNWGQAYILEGKEKEDVLEFFKVNN